MNIDIRRMVLVIGSAIDLVGVDDALHGRRVGVIAYECAKHLGWDQKARNMLFDAGLLHDCGVSSTREHHTIVSELDWQGSQAHCRKGYELLKDFRPLAHLAPIILYHHTHWEDLPTQKLSPLVSRFANLIYLADRIDAQAMPYYTDNSLLLHVEELRTLMSRYSGTFFAPELVDAFLYASQTEAFWLALDADLVHRYISEVGGDHKKQRISIKELKQFALIVADIVDAKSHFTTAHSLGVGRVARLLAGKMGITGKHLDLIEIAALLHDIGKLQIPDEVLESKAKLTIEERALIKKHSYVTYQILQRVGGFEELVDWASQHHESLRGDGYPFHLSGGEIPIESRIIKVADIYQALAQNRPYRSPMAPADILRLLRSMQTDSELDPTVVDFVERNLDECHKAAIGPEVE